MGSKKKNISTFGRVQIDIERMSAVLRERRLKLGLSQRELADRAGVGTTTIFNLEQGSCKVQLDIFLQVLSALDLTPNQIMEVDGNVTAVHPTEHEAQLIQSLRSTNISDILSAVARYVELTRNERKN